MEQKEHIIGISYHNLYVLNLLLFLCFLRLVEVLLSPDCKGQVSVLISSSTIIAGVRNHKRLFSFMFRC